MTTKKHRVQRFANSRTMMLICMVILLVTSASVFSAPLWHHVTVVSSEGWRFDDVTVVLSETANSLIVHHADSSKSTVAFKVIESITDALGNDITQHVLDPSVTNTEQYAPTQTVVSDSTATRFLKNGRFNCALGVQYGGSLFVGGGYSGRNGNLMIQPSLRLSVSRIVHIGAVLAVQRVRADESYFGYGRYSQTEVHALVGIHQRARNYRHVMLMADMGLGIARLNYGDGYHDSSFSLYGGVSLVVPAYKGNGFIFEVNTRLKNQNGTSGIAVGISLGAFFMHI